MEIIEQFKFEASERAGSPEGFLHLIKLVLSEIEKLDFNDPAATSLYVALLRAYVLVKRQLAVFNRRCECMAIDKTCYNETLRRLKYAIRLKRDEAREYAAKSIPPEKLKELKQYAGTHMGFDHNNFAESSYICQPPFPHIYPDMSKGRSYNRTN